MRCSISRSAMVRIHDMEIWLVVWADANVVGAPCSTNCVAFSIECKIPTPKRKKTAGKKEESSERAESSKDGISPAGAETFSAPPPESFTPDKVGMNTTAAIPKSEGSDQYYANQQLSNGTYAQFVGSIPIAMCRENANNTTDEAEIRAGTDQGGWTCRISWRIIKLVPTGPGSPWLFRCRALPTA